MILFLKADKSSYLNNPNMHKGGKLSESFREASSISLVPSSDEDPVQNRKLALFSFVTIDEQF